MARSIVKEITTNFWKLDKFERHDFRRWHKKMHFFLTTLKAVYVMTTPMPELLEDDTNVESAKELWDSLESKYMAEDASTKKFLVIEQLMARSGTNLKMAKLIANLEKSSKISRMPPKRTSTSEAPAMTQAAIRKLVADSVTAALEAQAATMANADNTNRNTGEREAPIARQCSYKEFMSCQPIKFKGPATGSNLLPVTVTCHACGEKGHYANECQKTTNNNAQGRAYMLRDRNAHQDPNVVTGTKGAVGLIRWFGRTESVFSRSNCTEDCKVKFSTGTLTKEAISWWNSFAQPIGIEEAYKITWVEFKKLLIKKYCPRTKVQKMEDEFYHLTVKGNDLKAYVRRFQELATLCPTMVSDSKKMMEVFIGGLPRSIQGNVTASKPQTLKEAFNIASEATDQDINKAHPGASIKPSDHELQKQLGLPLEANLLPVKVTCHDFAWEGNMAHQDPECSLGYISQGCQVFVIQVMEKKSDEKRLEDIPSSQRIPDVFPEVYLAFLTFARVEFPNSNLIPRSRAPVARSTDRLAPSEMQELF
ncbi:reverse transcriptase domain-containing protein [Tanacetum coccineum]